MLFKSTKSWFKPAGTLRKEIRRPRPATRTVRLILETLEERVVPVIGASVLPPTVFPGSNLDGVVQVVDTAHPADYGSGSELADNQTQILTAVHVIYGNMAETVNFNLQLAGAPVNISIPIAGQANAVMNTSPNFLFPTGGLAYTGTATLPGANDIGIITLRDPNPQVAGLAANLQMVAPYSPFEQGYAIATLPAQGTAGGVPAAGANQNGVPFNIVGYGVTGTGIAGITTASGAQLITLNGIPGPWHR